MTGSHITSVHVFANAHISAWPGQRSPQTSTALCSALKAHVYNTTSPAFAAECRFWRNRSFTGPPPLLIFGLPPLTVHSIHQPYLTVSVTSSPTPSPDEVQEPTILMAILSTLVVDPLAFPARWPGTIQKVSPWYVHWQIRPLPRRC